MSSPPADNKATTNENKPKKELPVVVCGVEGCQYQSRYKGNLKLHKVALHNIIVGVIHRCDFAGCSFTSGLTKKIWVHKASVHRIGVILFPCVYPGCGYKGSEKRSLRLHVESNHCDNPSNGFKCETAGGCQYIGRTPANLRYHMKKHKELPNWVGNLNWKAKTAMPKKSDPAKSKFKCVLPGCSFGSNQKRSYKDHLNYAHTDKIYKCDWPDCEHVSKHKAALTVHKRRIHGNPVPATTSGLAHNPVPPTKSGAASVVAPLPQSIPDHPPV
jgi:hypothetical protein